MSKRKQQTQKEAQMQIKALMQKYFYVLYNFWFYAKHLSSKNFLFLLIGINLFIYALIYFLFANSIFYEIKTLKTQISTSNINFATMDFATQKNQLQNLVEAKEFKQLANLDLHNLKIQLQKQADFLQLNFFEIEQKNTNNAEFLEISASATWAKFSQFLDFLNTKTPAYFISDFDISAIAFFENNFKTSANAKNQLSKKAQNSGKSEKKLDEKQPIIFKLRLDKISTKTNLQTGANFENANLSVKPNQSADKIYYSQNQADFDLQTDLENDLENSLETGLERDLETDFTLNSQVNLKELGIIFNGLNLADQSQAQQIQAVRTKVKRLVKQNAKLNKQIFATKNWNLENPFSYRILLNLPINEQIFSDNKQVQNKPVEKELLISQKSIQLVAIISSGNKTQITIQIGDGDYQGLVKGEYIKNSKLKLTKISKKNSWVEFTNSQTQEIFRLNLGTL